MEKLVRDKIPDIIKKKGEECDFFVAKGEELFRYMIKKLFEEGKEVEDAETDEEFKEEIADLLEVIYVLLEQKRVSLDDVEKIRKKKKKLRGGFTKGIILKNNL